ncbi:MAG: hypothetical protein JNL75_04770 [Chitinophagales bacterium]|nr:hypothetical protein [Chitinophagales bacterium]
MNYSLLFIFLYWSSFCFSQDSLIQRIEVPSLAVRFSPVLAPYGISIGIGVIGMFEKKLSDDNSICIGAKLVSFPGNFSNQTNSLAILEYRFYYRGKQNKIVYFAPYLKLRNLIYSDSEGAGISHFYKEKSLGIGMSIGKLRYLKKSRSISINYFLGAGYFIPLETYGETRLGSTILGNTFVIDNIIARPDIRIGILFGFDLSKK